MNYLLTITLCLTAVPVAMVAAADKIKTKTVEVVVASDPAGATIYYAGQPPQLLPIRTKVKIPVGRCIHPPSPFTIRWMSGAEVTTAEPLCLADGTKQTWTFLRPTGITGIEIDAQYAMHLEQLAQARQHAALMMALGLRVEAPQLQPYVMQPARPPLNVTCTSYRYGTMIQTHCR